MAETRNEIQITEAAVKEVEAAMEPRFAYLLTRTQSMEARLTAQLTEQNSKIDKSIADMFEAIRWHTKLKALQETDGIESYHDQFELICTRVTLPEDYLVTAYLAGLCTDTQMNVRMFRPQSIRQCLMIGKLYESAHPRQPRKSEKRSVPQKTEFRAPTLLHNSAIRKADEALGPTIAEDLDGNLTQTSAEFNNGIAKLSEFIKLGDQDSHEAFTNLEQDWDTQPNTNCTGIEKDSINFALNWREADLKDKLQQFDNPPPFQQAIEVSPTVEQDVLRECRNNFVKPHVQVDGSLGSAGVGMNFMQLTEVIDGYYDLSTPHGRWLRIADAESIKTVAISSGRQVFDNMPIRETQAINKELSCLIVHALIVYVPVDGCIVISFNKLLVFDPGGVSSLVTNTIGSIVRFSSTMVVIADENGAFDPGVSLVDCSSPTWIIFGVFTINARVVFSCCQREAAYLLLFSG